jgi:ubiquinone/menaquinone biosynthesis C-methylase UbiE
VVSQETIARMVRHEADMAFRRRVRTIFEWLEPQDDELILDCPCGRGFYLNYFRRVSRCRLVGLDLDYPVLRQGYERLRALENVAFIHGNIYHLPFPANFFDKVILSEVLEHIGDDVAGLREIRRVMKVGAVAAITVPNANYPFW